MRSWIRNDGSVSGAFGIPRWQEKRLCAHRFSGQPQQSQSWSRSSGATGREESRVVTLQTSSTLSLHKPEGRNDKQIILAFTFVSLGKKKKKKNLVGFSSLFFPVASFLSDVFPLSFFFIDFAVVMEAYLHFQQVSFFFFSPCASCNNHSENATWL